MLKIKGFPMNMLDEMCYIVSDETRQAIIIDCGALGDSDENTIKNYIKQEQLTITHHLCTHMHYDHCFGVAFIRNEYGVAPEFNIADENLYRGEGDSIFGSLKEYMRSKQLPKASRYLSDGDDIKLGNHNFKVIATPGHTTGGLCFYCENEKIVFAGDTLFYCSVGRTDFPGGSAEILTDSIINKLFTLPDSTIVYPGHGPKTEIAFEKANNPYVRF